MVLSHLSGYRFLAPIGVKASEIARAASRFLGVPCVAADVDFVGTHGAFVAVDVVPMPSVGNPSTEAWIRMDLADGSLRVAS